MFTEKKKKVLVLTLYCGENEYKQSIDSLKNQNYICWKHKLFSNLPNKKAHDKLYKYIMNHVDEYDLFVKMDADMVFKNRYVLENIVKFFDSCLSLDQANFSVLDVLSGQEIMGMLVFSNRVSWQTTNEKLFVDHTPNRSGIRLLVWDNPSPVALHCPNPSFFQAFHFGAHRALKATQRERDKKRWIQSAIQWHLLMGVWKKYLKLRDRQRGFMLLGALSVWRKDVDLTANEYSNDSLKKEFNRYKKLSNEKIYLLLKQDWSKVIFYNHLLYILLWPKIFEYKIRSRIKTWYRVDVLHNLAKRL